MICSFQHLVSQTVSWSGSKTRKNEPFEWPGARVVAFSQSRRNVGHLHLKDLENVWVRW